MIDFTKLQEEDLDIFLEENGIIINNLIYNDKIIKAEDLFEEDKIIYTFPVKDLIIASKEYDIIQQYTIEDLNDLTYEKKEDFAKTFKLDVIEDNFLERLIRILGFLGLITYNNVLHTLIVGLLDYRTIKSLYAMNNLLSNVYGDENFWRNLYHNKYGKPRDENLDKSYEKLFIIKEIQEDFFPYPIRESNITINNPKDISLELRYDYNLLARKNVEYIGKGLAKNTSVTSLSFFDHKIGDEGAKEIAKGLVKNTSLISLGLTTNKIGDEGAKAIGDMLGKNSSLTELYLQENDIGGEGAKAIGKGLSKNNSLNLLHLDSNQIGNEGAKAIGNMLAKNTSLTTLFIQNNYIYDEGAKEIVNGLHMNTSLIVLYFQYYNYAEPQTLDEIELLIERNRVIDKFLF